MSSLTPAYRLTIYTHKSLDATETAVLTPIAGAAHSEAFRVVTIAGITAEAPQLVVHPDDFTAWIIGGTPTLTGGQARRRSSMTIMPAASRISMKW